MSRIYYDAEMTGLHRNTTLISLGMVSESGKYFYAEFTDYDSSQVNLWIRNNVLDNLIFDSPKFDIINATSKGWNVEICGTKEEIKKELLEWLDSELISTDNRTELEIENGATSFIEIFTDCYAYDWMLLVDLLAGDAMSMPEYISYIPIDLSTLLWVLEEDPDITREEFIFSENKNNSIPKGLKKHNSLYDAYVIKECFEKVDQMLNAIEDYDDIDD